MKKKPEAMIYEDGWGMFTLHCKTKEHAHQAMVATAKEHIDEGGLELEAYFEKSEDVEIDINKIQSDRIYTNHKKCGGCYYNVGDNICNECGESINTKGIETFTYTF